MSLADSAESKHQSRIINEVGVTVLVSCISDSVDFALADVWICISLCLHEALAEFAAGQWIDKEFDNVNGCSRDMASCDKLVAGKQALRGSLYPSLATSQTNENAQRDLPIQKRTNTGWFHASACQVLVVPALRVASNCP